VSTPSMKGLPSLLMFPISVHHVKQMLELTALSPAQTRDVLMYVLGTVMCMRVNEVDQLKICDVLWRFDGGFHPRFRTRWRAASTRESRSRPGRECTRALGRQYSRASLRTLTTQDWRWRRTAPRVARQITNAVLNALWMIGVDTMHCSGLSMWRGGISAALTASVLVPTLFYSGHSSNCAAQNYMVPKNPDVL